jgi:PAS domain S-box-containing protein
MGDTNQSTVGPIRLRRYARGLLAVWTAVVGGTAAWELRDEANQVLEIARGEARSALEKNLVFSRWATNHGGVYVPVTEKTPPSPYLADSPERDIVTPAGRRLTLLSPTYMMRQVNELSTAESWLHTRLTSLNPVNPRNRPDPWEAETLRAFDGGQKEQSSIETVDGQQYMRLMWPVYTEDACLTCHAEQGHRPGDLRGGMSVSVPMAPLEQFRRQEMVHRVIGYGTMWVLGLGGIVLASRRLHGQMERRRHAEAALRESEAQVRETAAHIPGVVYQFVLHPDGSYTFPYVSQGLTEILGLTPEEVRRDAALLFPGSLPEEEPEPIWQSIRESAQKMTTWRRELRCRSTRGESKWIRVSASPHRLPDGSVLWNGVFLDITEHKEADRELQEAHDLLEQRVGERTVELKEANRELQKEIADRKQAEKWLLESEARFRSFFELGLVGMAIVSPQQDWEEANDRLCEMLGYSPEELIAKTWAKLIHPDDRETDEAQFKRALAGTISGYSAHRRLVHKDGQIVYAKLSVRCLRGADGAVDSLIVLVQDVGEPGR